MILFTAPRDFDKAVEKEYEQLDTVLWNPGYYYDVFSNEKVTIWVCDPKASFIINGQLLDDYPNLKILVTPSTGTNHLDLEECAKRNIKVISLLDDREGLEGISASAEFTLHMLISALRLHPARELRGKSVCLVGYGRIGHKLEKYLNALDAYPFLYDPVTGSVDMTLEFGFRNCDAVIICCTYNKSTHHMITADLLRSMKQGAALVNTARGEIIDEYALAMVMEERPDLRVAVDVLEGEVTGTQNPQRLISRGAIVTPHLAGATHDSRTKAARIILNLLKREIENGKL